MDTRSFIILILPSVFFILRILRSSRPTFDQCSGSNNCHGIPRLLEIRTVGADEGGGLSRGALASRHEQSYLTMLNDESYAGAENGFCRRHGRLYPGNALFTSRVRGASPGSKPDFQP